MRTHLQLPAWTFARCGIDGPKAKTTSDPAKVDCRFCKFFIREVDGRWEMRVFLGTYDATAKPGDGFQWLPLERIAG